MIIKYIRYFTILSVLLLTLGSCKEMPNDKAADTNLVDARLLEESLDRITIQPVSKKDLNGYYNVSIRFNESVSDQNLPDGLFISDFSDSELLLNSAENKLHYFGKFKNNMIKAFYLNSADGINQGDTIKDFSFECKVSFTKVGEYDKNCEKRCPKKSMFGGKTWFCVCFYDCKFKKTWP